MGVRGPIGKQAKGRAVRTSKGVQLHPLPVDAGAIFKRLAKDIDGLAAGDVALLELQSYWLEIAKECRRQMATDGGLSITMRDTAHGDGTEMRKNPILIVLRTATEQVRAIAQQLGASPMARARLPVDEKETMSIAEMLFADASIQNG
jgi:P27 family predicted phage terminase small subunit